jgi:hypothetical protein
MWGLCTLKLELLNEKKLVWEQEEAQVWKKPKQA